jgi:peptidoglycan/xylan/chitin deacetylase (PgdA/CDA1 family)
MSVKISIHVDGYYGLVEGVPNLLKLFKKYRINATFYVNMGRESFILDYLKYKRNQMENTLKLVERYTLLQKMFMVFLRRGLGYKHCRILNRILKEGHKLGIHCWNHLEWSKNFKNFDYKKQIYLSKKFYIKCTGEEPKKFVAPTWKIDKRILSELKKQGFEEVQIQKGQRKQIQNDFGLRFDELTFDKTIEELLNEKKNKTEILEIYKKEMKKKNANVYFHADYEGRNGIKLMEEILR